MRNPKYDGSPSRQGGRDASEKPDGALPAAARGIRLLWLGPPGIEVDGARIRLEFKKSVALVSYLSLGRSPVRRESLAALFWPDRDRNHSSGSLRRTLASIRKKLPVSPVVADRDDVEFKPSAVPEGFFLDVDGFRGAIRACRDHCGAENVPCRNCMDLLEEAAALCRGDFLQGLNLPDCPDFDDWQLLQRANLRDELSDVLLRLSKGYEASAQWDGAVFHARRLMSLDRFSDSSSRNLIRVYACAGRKNPALRQYEEFRDFLADERAGTPERDTTELYLAIRSGSFPPHRTDAPGSGPPPVGIPSVADAGVPVLNAKLRIPRLRKDLAERGGLLKRLEETVDRRMTLVLAPPGSGKTTLLADWALRSRRKVAWISLEEGDAEPVRFLRLLIASLRTLRPDIGETALAMMSPGIPTPPSNVLILLLNELSAIHESLVLILDDVHVLRPGPPLETLCFFLDNLPDCLSVVLSAQSDPRLPTVRYLAEDRMTVLGASDLRFTEREAADFLRRTMGLELDPDQCRTLWAKTEGWAAGLQLAGISLRSGNDPGRLIENFNGSERHVLTYFVQEVVKRHPPAVQSFLSVTSVLDRFCEPLCSFMLDGRADAGESLRICDRENLFLVPLDGEGKWYRYHRLFSETLRSVLAENHPERLPLLHSRASRWFERNGDLDEAVRHAHEAGDTDRVTDIVERNAKRLIHGGMVSKLAEWIGYLPAETVKDKPWFRILYAWGLVQKAEADCAEPVLSRAGADLGTGDTAADNDWLGIILGLRALIADMRGNTSRTIAFASDALRLLPPSSAVPRGLAGFALGRAYFQTGDFLHARPLFEELARDGLDTGEWNRYAPCIGALAGMMKLEGNLRDAESLCLSAIRIMESEDPRRFFFGGNVHLELGDLLREYGRLDDAEREADLGLRLNRPWGNRNVVVLGHVLRARVLIARGDHGGAAAVLEEASRGSTGDLYDDVRSQLNSCRVRLTLLTGDIDAAMRSDRECNPSNAGEGTLWREQDLMTRSRILIARGRYDEAVTLLRQLAGTAENHGRIGRLVYMLNFLSVALLGMGETVQACAVLRKSLRLAEPRGFRRIFIDEGEPVRILLASLRDEDLAGRITGSEPHGEYLSSLLAAFPVQGSGGTAWNGPALAEPGTR